MYKQLKVISLFVLAGLGGCVTSEQIDAGVTTLEGKSYKEAFAKLGFPDEERKIAGQTVYLWNNRDSGTFTVPTYETATTYVGGQAVTTSFTGSHTRSYDYHCTLKLVVDPKGTVIDASVDGNIGGCERYAALAPKKKS
ncbi:hypothetical protein ASF03_07740 [Rhizobium sp. Leaf68]|jgi:hypothetical protein|uniref:hypothetical protein n=1 Tax=Agrobacterium cavarae TaxID=2528239 RepID=UPI00071413FA|nr:hypothetical protein ASE62_07630 [Rhizobium sp. Leaf202]KQN85553.1 hypothetical protein ASF03_07740 [Rhizobium sp. Leaf68]